MIELAVLILLSVMDVKKREISMISMLGASIILAYPVMRGEKIWSSGLLFGFFFVSISFFTKQALGMADSIVFLLLGMKINPFHFLFFLFVSFSLALFFQLILRGISKKREKSLPFLPFIALAYFLFLL